MRALLSTLVLLAAAVAGLDEAAKEADVIASNSNLPVGSEAKVSVYGPLQCSTQYLKYIINAPLFASFRMDDSKEASVFLLRNGLRSIWADSEFEDLRKFMMSEPEMALVLQSSARFLEIPELQFNANLIRTGSDSTLDNVLHFLSESNTPFVFLFKKSALPAMSGLEMMGQIQLAKDKVTYRNFFNTEVCANRKLMLSPALRESSSYIDSENVGFVPQGRPTVYRTTVQRPVTSFISQPYAYRKVINPYASHLVEFEP